MQSSQAMSATHQQSSQGPPSYQQQQQQQQQPTFPTKQAQPSQPKLRYRFILNFFLLLFFLQDNVDLHSLEDDF